MTDSGSSTDSGSDTGTGTGSGSDTGSGTGSGTGGGTGTGGAAEAESTGVVGVLDALFDRGDEEGFSDPSNGGADTLTAGLDAGANQLTAAPVLGEAIDNLIGQDASDGSPSGIVGLVAVLADNDPSNTFSAETVQDGADSLPIQPAMAEAADATLAEVLGDLVGNTGSGTMTDSGSSTDSGSDTGTGTGSGSDSGGIMLNPAEMSLPGMSSATLAEASATDMTLTLPNNTLPANDETQQTPTTNESELLALTGFNTSIGSQSDLTNALSPTLPL